MREKENIQKKRNRKKLQTNKQCKINFEEKPGNE